MIKEEIRLVYLKLLRWLGFNDSYVHYIAGNDKLPAPLSEEEEYELFPYRQDISQVRQSPCYMLPPYHRPASYILVDQEM